MCAPAAPFANCCLFFVFSYTAAPPPHQLRAGYQYRVEVAQASLLGAAQSRVRAFVVAARCGLLLPDAPRPTHAPPPPPPGRSAAAHAVTLFSGQPQLAEARSAFSAAPTAAAGGAAAAALAAAELRALHALPPHVSVRSALAGLPLEAPWRPNAQHGREPMDAHLARPFAGDASKYRRVSLDGVSPTILTSEPAPSAANARLHPQADRVLSPLERGRLQTFPPGWRWTARFAHGGAPPGATGSRAGAGALSPLQLSALASWHRQARRRRARAPHAPARRRGPGGL